MICRFGFGNQSINFAILSKPAQCALLSHYSISLWNREVLLSLTLGFIIMCKMLLDGLRLSCPTRKWKMCAEGQVRWNSHYKWLAVNCVNATSSGSPDRGWRGERKIAVIDCSGRRNELLCSWEKCLWTQDLGLVSIVFVASKQSVFPWAILWSYSARGKRTLFCV